MSEPLAVVLGHDALRVFGRAASAPVCEVPWSGDAPDAAVQLLAAQVAAPSSLTLVVGLAWLDIARPALPPVTPTLRRRMLHLATDRWFAATEPAAFALHDELAFAMPAALLQRWREAFGRWAPVRAVTTLPQAAWLVGGDGAWRTEAGPGEHGAITVHDGRLTEVRRARRAVEAAAALDLGACAGAVLTVRAVPSSLQLLDVAMDQRLAAQQQRRWWRAGGVCAAALALCLWAVGAARERELAATEALVARLEREALPARTADARLQRALAEQDGLHTDADQAARPGAPARVLARLGALLPADAFVQRLEWDGRQWRIDGSAVDAAALVPRLDADATFDDVRSLAPSTRFLDGGRPRTSFSIGFRLREGA